MNIIRPSAVRMFFDNPLARDMADASTTQSGSASDGSVSDAEIAADLFPATLDGEFVVDLEAHGAFHNWIHQHIARSIGIGDPRTTIPFEFYPPTFYHGDMVCNESDRRHWPCPASATGKSEHSLGVYGARLLRASNVGKTESATVLHDRLIREMSNYTFGKLGRTFGQSRMPNKRYIPTIVALLCKNWEENK